MKLKRFIALQEIRATLPSSRRDFEPGVGRGARCGDQGLGFRVRVQGSGRGVEAFLLRVDGVGFGKSFFNVQG